MAETRVLVANRGEIAIRVMRTCREMGIPTVAVYSDADREALFVEMADDAYHLGSASPSESYLNIPRILDAAGRSRATVVHPGYGFLAENAEFARATAEAGLTFVGPPPEAMTLMGDKAAARRTAERVGAPTIPGTPDPITPQRAPAEADRIGFPIVVKAAFGGGGKGMHLVATPEELTAAVERSSREARAYFGRPEVYLERYITRAHHVEAQIVADRHGHVSFLGERDCSLQRRYQKLVEESPSPVVDEGLRGRIGGAAVAIATAAGYVGAGTVEFLVAEDGSFYFIEMNARLQVEHPVTEMVTGIDLVRLQLLVAMGEDVEVHPRPRGHAIECRINAEDPYRDFLPGPGMVTRYRSPGGPFVRLDSGVAEGRRVVGDYDSLMAKLIAWGEDRENARRRMLRALDEFVVEGVPTTMPFHRWVLDTEEFRAGTIHTKWVEEALAAGGLKPKDEAASVAVGETGSGGPIRLLVEVDGHRVPVKVWGDEARVAPPPPTPTAHGHAHAGAGEVIAAPMQGTILQVLVEAGQEVEAGQTVCILEAMKMENHIVAAREGKVVEVAVSKGDVVDTGQPLAFLD
jgi:acetyl-CoA/propionyl-CoA/long-chain acyl-CoA carboxylase, biotin carboxylase, biotin carboxyl carrier protein